MRVVTNKDVMRYERLVNMYLKNSVIKNWNEATLSKADSHVSLGNTGMTMEDMKQYLYTEVVVAIQKYDPNYRTEEGKSVKELTFVYNHLRNRIGQLMIRLTKKRKGYGIWMSDLQQILGETNQEEPY